MSLGTFLRGVVRDVRRRVSLPPPSIPWPEINISGERLLHGRKALVTGAGRNIGRSIALEMARQGADVYFMDRDAAAVAKLQSELQAIGGRCRGLVSDVSKPAEVEQLCATLDGDGFLVDLLVNNVGVGSGDGLQTLEMSAARELFETNVFGPLQLTQHVAKALIANGRSGSILFLSSVLARITSGMLIYGATKAALDQMVREMAYELAAHRIRVNGIAPGAVLVDDEGKLPPFPHAPLYGSHIHPQYIARAAVYLSSEHFSQFTTGSVLTMDAGVTTRGLSD